ncbi:MAG: hypothetical protein HQK68_08015 [Desulfamplus sp.]|nr:hypothetical protein [Desulfamplus sp.]
MEASELNGKTTLLLSEIKQQNKELISQLENLKNEIEIRKAKREQLLKKLVELKGTVSSFISEEDNLTYQKRFLESEKEKLLKILNSVSATYDENMMVLEDLMQDVNFMNGEIETLQSKSQILEAEIPFKFKDSENLDNRVKTSFFRAINNLQKRINDVQKKIEVIYYKKGEI